MLAVHHQLEYIPIELLLLIVVFHLLHVVLYFGLHQFLNLLVQMFLVGI